MRNTSTYHQDEREIMRNLATSRRWLNLNGLRRFDLTDVERARRVEVYRRQVEAHGHITEFLLPPGEQSLQRRPSPHGRFRDGDALLRHRAG